MPFEDEWAQIKSDAVGSENDRVQLDGGSGGGRSSDLNSSKEQKEKAANYISETLGPAVVKRGAKAGTDSEGVAGRSGSSRTDGDDGLTGWRIMKGMDHCLDNWNQKIKKMTNLLDQEQKSLRGASRLIRGQDSATAESFASPHPRIDQSSTSYPRSRISDC